MEWIDGVKRDLFKDICIIFRLFPADEERKLRRYCPLSAGPKIIVVKLSANPGMLEKNDCNDVVTELYLMGERASSQQYQNAIQYNLSIVALPKPKGTAYILAGTKLVQYMYLLAKWWASSHMPAVLYMSMAWKNMYGRLSLPCL